MRRFSAHELGTFLAAVDAVLVERARVIVIGGSALALGYGVGVYTNDIETYSCDLDGIEEAARAARARTGLAIPLANSTVAQLPPGFETRLKRVMPELERLEVWSPIHTTSLRASCCVVMSTTANN